MTGTKKRLNLNMIKNRHEKLKLTQKQVAQFIGIPSDKYSKRESGDYKFQAEELPNLSIILQTKMENFFE